VTSTIETGETDEGPLSTGGGLGDHDAHFEAAADQTIYPDPPLGIDPDQSKGWLSRLAPLLATHRWIMISSLIGAAIAMALGALVPLVTRNAIDQALDAQTASLSSFVIMLVVIGVLRALFTFGYRYGLFGMAFRIEYQLRTMLHVHLSTLSFSFYDRVQSGQIISRANSDIRSVQMFLTFAPIMAVQGVSFVLALAIMLSIDVTLTIVAMIALPGVFVFGQKLRNLIFPISWIVQARMADVATVVDENINGVRVVKSFAAEERQVNALADSAFRLRWAQMQSHYARARYNPIIENIPRLGLALMLLYGGLEVIDGNLTIGDLVAFNLYIVILQAPFRFVGMVLMMSQRAKASAERIFEVLDEQPTVVDRPGAFDLVAPAGAIEFDSVTFAYGTETIGGAEGVDSGHILSDFNLSIAPGERVAIVGKTGSGKSTIARLLLRFYDTESGRITLDGNDVRDITGRSLRHAVGLVPDEPFLFSTTVHENIAYARPDATRSEVEAAARASNAHEFITDLDGGYDSVVGERGYDLSGGQRQRIAIARTLLANPRVLLLDDATSAIDVHVEEQIHEALIELMHDRTTIIIAHRLSTISLADRVVLIDNGRVLADGTHLELLANEPRYAAVLAAGDNEHGEAV
jgi:ATP-binding cassette subfamily B protein